MVRLLRSPLHCLVGDGASLITYTARRGSERCETRRVGAVNDGFYAAGEGS